MYKKMYLMQLMPSKWICLAYLAMISACQDGADKALPYLGDSEEVNGQMVYYRVPSFEYLDQDSTLVSDVSLQGNIYVADLFFTSCPTICPKVKQQLLRIDQKFPDDDRLKFLSMSIDYRKDSVPVLKRYAEKLGIRSERWHLVQLPKEEISSVANQYFNVAFEDESAPGGFDHSGRLILVDTEGHIRSHCDGTDPTSVDNFVKDIAQLLDEKDT